MNFYNRTLKSILRNKFQSIVLFLIVLILGNVLFAAIAVKQTSINVKDELKQRSTSYLILSRTKTKGNSHVDQKMEMLIEELKNYENQDFIATIDYNPIVTVYYPRSYTDSTIFDFNRYSGLNNVSGSFYDYEMVEGRFYTQEEIENGEFKIVLDESLGYQVGDIYEINLHDYEVNEPEAGGGYVWEFINFSKDNVEKVQFEVIGIYKEKTLKERFEDISINESVEIPLKCITEMTKISKEMIDKHSEYDSSQLEFFSQFIDVDFELKSNIPLVIITTNGIEANEKVEEYIKSSENYQGFYYKMKSSAQDYRYIQAPLENLVALANVTLVASIILVIVILSLVSNLFIKNRSREIGILMAIGEKKEHLIIQFVCEILLIGLLATSISMISGNILGDNISREFMKIQIDVDSEMDYQEDNPNELTQIDLLETYKVEISGDYIITIYIVSTIILIVSSILPVMNILKTKPKEILM